MSVFVLNVRTLIKLSLTYPCILIFFIGNVFYLLVATLTSDTFINPLPVQRPDSSTIIMISNIVRIPKALLQDRVLVFLNIEDLVLFDTAVLNHLLRGQMLELLQGVALHTQPIKINADSGEWFLKRNIRVSALYISKMASELAIVKQLACSVDSHIKFSGCKSDALITCIPSCSNVKSLQFMLCFNNPLQGAVFHSIAKYCPMLESINLSHNLRIYVSDLTMMISGCKRITDIDLSYSTVWVNFDVIRVIAVNCPQLRKFVVEGCEALRDDSIELLAQHCRELRYLSVSACKALTDTSLQALADCCVELRTFLSLNKNLITTDGIIALARGCTKLEEVGVPQCDELVDLAVVALVQHCPALSVLHCWSNHVTDASLQALQQCQHFNTLELLNANAISSRELMQLLSHCAMEHLNLSGCQFHCPPTNAVAVPHVPTSCPSLSFLSFRYCTSLTDTMFAALISQCPCITELNLDDCIGLTEAAVLAIAGHCKKLEILNILRVPVSDAAMCAVAKNCPNLRTLYAYSCSLHTDAALSALAQHCSNLRHLDVSNCTLITDAGVEEILQKCRQLRTLKLAGCVQLTNKVLDAILSYGLHMRIVDLSNIDGTAAASFRSAKPNCTLNQDILSYARK